MAPKKAKIIPQFISPLIKPNPFNLRSSSVTSNRSTSVEHFGRQSLQMDASSSSQQRFDDFDNSNYFDEEELPIKKKKRLNNHSPNGLENNYEEVVASRDEMKDGDEDDRSIIPTNDVVAMGQITPYGKKIATTMQSIEKEMNNSLECTQQMMAVFGSAEGKSVEETLKILLDLHYNQTAWMAAHTKIMIKMYENVHRPSLTLMADLGQRRHRKMYGTAKDDELPWKNGALEIQVGAKSFPLSDFTRAEIKELVRSYQDKGIWTEPKLGDLPLKNEIQLAMNQYFDSIDEPRKIGYIVGQFLHSQVYYTKNFIGKFYGEPDRKGRDAWGRVKISEREKTLFMEIVLYCGANLLVNYPKQGSRTKSYGYFTPGNEHKNLQLEFVNNARDSVNQFGHNLQKKTSGAMKDYMSHVEGFQPIFEREEYKQKLMALIAEDSRVAEKENRSSKRGCSSVQILNSTPRTTRPVMKTEQQLQRQKEAQEELSKILASCGKTN